LGIGPRSFGGAFLAVFETTEGLDLAGGYILLSSTFVAFLAVLVFGGEGDGDGDFLGFATAFFVETGAASLSGTSFLFWV